MNVLQLSSERSWRGGEQQLAYLVEGLQKKGVNSVIAVRKHSVFEEYCKKRKWRSYSLPFANEFDIFSANLVKRICKRENIDVIHAHSAHSHALAVWAAVLGSKAPIVLSRRVDFPVKDNRLSKFKYNYPGIKKIICVSNAIKEIMAPAIKDKSKLITIYDGVDLNRFATGVKANILRKEFNIPSAELLIGNVAALAPHKDYFTFLETAKLLSEKIKSRFIIIGEGNLRSAIEERITALELQHKVVLTGFRNDLETVFPELDIFLFTSETEGLGSSVLDAMLCNVPIVATRAGGVPEIVEHEKTGLLAPVKDAAMLAANVLRLTGDNTLRENIVRRAKEQVKNFSKENMAEKTLEVYKTVAMASS